MQTYRSSSGYMCNILSGAGTSFAFWSSLLRRPPSTGRRRPATLTVRPDVQSRDDGWWGGWLRRKFSKRTMTLRSGRPSIYRRAVNAIYRQRRPTVGHCSERRVDDDATVARSRTDIMILYRRVVITIIIIINSMQCALCARSEKRIESEWCTCKTRISNEKLKILVRKLNVHSQLSCRRRDQSFSRPSLFYNDLFSDNISRTWWIFYNIILLPVKYYRIR